MNPPLKEVGSSPMLWLLALVPVVFVAAELAADAHTLLFVLSVLAIVPLATLLSHATESEAAKTGDAAGGSGRSAWFVGVLVLMVYLVFAMTLCPLPPRG